jgi:hypothetical protein
MRWVTASVGVGLLSAAAGCANFPYGPTPPRPLPRVEPAATPSAAQLVNYLNKNAKMVQTLEVTELNLDCRQDSQPVALEAKLFCRKARDFRLLAKSIAGPEVDVGSNGEEFWFWIKRAPEPYVFHCAYADLPQVSQKLQLPFQPDYVLEAMGLTVSATPEACEVKARPGEIELIEKATSAQGQSVTKVVVFDSAPTDEALGNRPRIKQRLLRDAQGKVIASATVTKEQIIAGARLPLKMTIEYPAEKARLDMHLMETRVNAQFTEERAATLFTRRNLSNIRSFDLAKGPDQGRPTANAAIRPAGGIPPR